MERLLNHLRGLLGIVSEVENLRAEVKELQRKNHLHDLNEQMLIGHLRRLIQRLEHSEQLQASEARALKAEIENALLRFERRLPPDSPR